MMFGLSEEQLTQMGAAITTREIAQQPDLWIQAWSNYKKEAEAIDQFLDQVLASSQGQPVRVIFTGAGTSEYVGNTVLPHLLEHGNRQQFQFQSIATTDLVSTPYAYLFPDETVLLVSFARSGNSPESVAAVQLADQLVDRIFHLTITCAPDGQLAKLAQGRDNNYLMLMPGASNDAGFAMTGSFTCMTLSALLIFDSARSLQQKEAAVRSAADAAREVLAREEQIQDVVDLPFNRIAYLGSGPLAALAKEAQLKILELTAGQVATIYDSSMGFRHGPKSFVDEQTLVIGFVSNQPYTRQYDEDLLQEVHLDGIACQTLAVGQGQLTTYQGSSFSIRAEETLADAYMALPIIVFAQTVALLTSVKVNNRPDTPSASGQVNRVVKGVIIHSYQEEN